MKTSPPFVTIVSGSPRDGTAKVMQMLMAGELAVLVDDVHKAGTPEPHGYYDYEPSLMLDVDDKTKEWVAGAHGKAVKVMPYQLQYLPPAFGYRVVFVCRRIAEVLGLMDRDGTARGGLRAWPRRGRPSSRDRAHVRGAASSAAAHANDVRALP